MNAYIVTLSRWEDPDDTFIVFEEGILEAVQKLKQEDPIFRDRMNSSNLEIQFVPAEKVIR